MTKRNTVAFAENPDSVPTTHVVVQTICNYSFRESVQICTWYTYNHTGNKSINVVLILFINCVTHLDYLTSKSIKKPTKILVSKLLKCVIAYLYSLIK